MRSRTLRAICDRRRRLCVLVSVLLLLSASVIFLHSQCCGETENRNGGAAETRTAHTNGRQPLKTHPLSSTAARTPPSSPPAAQKPSRTVEEDEESCDHLLGGFALSLAYHDQQTWACGNVLALQSWAATLNLSVLEPFLLSTRLGLSGTAEESSTLPLSALYDMDYWNENARINERSPTVPWRCFLQRAPRNMILVNTETLVHTCNTKNVQSHTQFLRDSFGFSVVREMCLAPVASRSRLSVAEFNKRILGGHSPGEVTVVFSEWSQNTVGSVLDMNYAHVPLALSTSLPLRPSNIITNDADTYIDRFLGGGDFVAVLLRSEWLSMYSSVSVFNNTLQDCLTKTMGYIHTAREKLGTDRVFVGLDVGKYGSKTIELEREELALRVLNERLLHATQFQSFQDWDMSFESVSQYSVPGYVALLQRTIAVRGSCLLLMGSGSFLKQALDLYKLAHWHNKSDQCYISTDSKCNSFKRIGLQ